MRHLLGRIKKLAKLCHRWMGVAFCLLFSWWFISGIFMMYWDFPGVEPADRLAHSRPLNAAEVRLSPAEAYAVLQQNQPPDGARLAIFDGRPAYFFRIGREESIVYADRGEAQTEFPPDLNLRTAAAWTGKLAAEARMEAVNEVDQWTVGGVFRSASPLVKYSWPDGEQVYVSEASGEVVQYTTRSSRIFAHLGAIPHWLYYTPLRKNGALWTRIVVWASGIATVAALLGLIAGISMYSPSKRYRFKGAPTSIPYQGQKRLHTILGLFFGIVACTWAFSGMLSMEPFPLTTGGGARSGRGGAGARISAALRGARFQFAAFDARHPRQAIALAMAQLRVKQLDFMFFAGEPVYLATENSGRTLIVPVQGEPRPEFDRDRILDVLRSAAGPGSIAEMRVLTAYDAYYLDRHDERPLPVILTRLSDPDNTRYYIDPRTARVVGNYSSRSWMNRWLYHGLHSLNFPWLYNYRPAWDIVVLALMLGGVWLCMTSVIIGYLFLRRKLPFHF